MPKHYHFQLNTRHANLGKSMQAFNTSFSLAMNRRRRKGGHLFQCIYAAQLVQTELYKTSYCGTSMRCWAKRENFGRKSMKSKINCCKMNKKVCLTLNTLPPGWWRSGKSPPRIKSWCCRPGGMRWSLLLLQVSFSSNSYGSAYILFLFPSR
jgi:hypothetical protein